MKRVVKAASPDEFEAWKALENDVWTPSYADLQNPEKRALHNALLKEQGWVCCYCGRAISLSDSHIEHFRPQEAREDLALDYQNLHASCIRESEPGSPLHCGHAKGNDFDETRAISPLDENCERRFAYTLDGHVVPFDPDDEAALYMRSLLRLDIAFLQNRRTAVLALVFDPEFLASATDAELAALSAAYRRPDADGRLEALGHVLARFSEQLIRG